jgi:hypothetical protein
VTRSIVHIPDRGTYSQALTPQTGLKPVPFLHHTTTATYNCIPRVFVYSFACLFCARYELGQYWGWGGAGNSSLHHRVQNGYRAHPASYHRDNFTFTFYIRIMIRPLFQTIMNYDMNASNSYNYAAVVRNFNS